MLKEVTRDLCQVTRKVYRFQQALLHPPGFLLS